MAKQPRDPMATVPTLSEAAALAAAEQTERQLEQLDATRMQDKSDDEVHQAHSSPLILPPTMKNQASPKTSFRTDDDVHNDAGQRTPQTIIVKPGDKIVYYANVGRWFLAKPEHLSPGSLNPNRSILAEALKSFVYREGVGALYHNVQCRILRRYFKPRQDTLTGANIPGGDIPLFDPDAKRYTTSPVPQGQFAEPPNPQFPSEQLVAA